MADYRLLTTWLLDGTEPRAAWDVLADVTAWPSWWRGVEAASELAPGDERRVGSRYRVRWRSAIPYAVEFDFIVDEVDAPSHMAGRASGELEGSGVWRLFQSRGVTAVTYDWNVRTSRAWMNTLAPVARPVFRWNHDRVMTAGGQGLAAKLGARLLSGG